MKQTAMLHAQMVPIESLDAFDKILSREEELLLSIPPVLLSKATKESYLKNVFNRIYLKESYIPEEGIEIIKTNLKKGHITLFQEGLWLHYCEGCFQEWYQKGGRENPNAWPDPWHENYYCKDSRDINQDKLILKGLDLIIDKLYHPEGYCPAQHYCDEETIRAVDNHGFEYLAIRNLTNLPVWKEGKHITMLPCAKLEEKYSEISPIVFEYWDRIWNTSKFEAFSKIHKNSVSPSKHPPSKKPKTKFKINQELLIQAKKLRDKKKMLRNLVNFNKH